jgi:hypothetical protein
MLSSGESFKRRIGMRAYDIEAQINHLRARQISVARYCRAQAAAVRNRAAQSKSPTIQAKMFALALRYEQIADSVEHYLRRLSETSTTYRRKRAPHTRREADG